MISKVNKKKSQEEKAFIQNLILKYYIVLKDLLLFLKQ